MKLELSNNIIVNAFSILWKKVWFPIFFPGFSLDTLVSAVS